MKTLFCAAVAQCFIGACTRQVAPLVVPGESAVALTAGPNTSAIYLARTSAGVIAIDLGWWGYRRPLDDGLKQLEATPKDVVMVFLTHSHRDHIAAWPVVRHARFVIGADTLRAYVVAGHTAGSAVYLFRGILFLGDAVTYSRLRGFMPARWMFSDDRRVNAKSLEQLWTRLPPDGVHYVCTAHARCGPYSPRFVEDVSPSR